MSFHLTCPECKNDVDLSSHSDIKKDQILECNHCGITLQVSNVSNDEVKTEIVEEAK